jgi:hypothetical protein
MQAISLNLNFSGAVLPVVEGEDGHRRVPLKPICDAIGVGWETQLKKVMVDGVKKQLGVCLISIQFAGQGRSMTMIRVDRVAGFLNRINPNCVRGAGNASAADFIESKRNEWDEAIHLFEKEVGRIFRRTFPPSPYAIATA